MNRYAESGVLCIHPDIQQGFIITAFIICAIGFIVSLIVWYDKYDRPINEEYMKQKMAIIKEVDNKLKYTPLVYKVKNDYKAIPGKPIPFK